MILGARGALAPVWGRVSKVVSTKNSKPLSHFGDIFRTFRDFLTLYFSFIFEVTSDTELYALWARKGAQKMVFGEAFRSDSEVSGESWNEAPVLTAAPFSKF